MIGWCANCGRRDGYCECITPAPDDTVGDEIDGECKYCKHLLEDRECLACGGAYGRYTISQAREKVVAEIMECEDLDVVQIVTGEFSHEWAAISADEVIKLLEEKL